MRISAALIFLIALFSCASEPHQIVYEFKMINDTDEDFLVRKHYKGSTNVFKADTLFSGSEIVFVVPRVGSYGQAFGENLISAFFDTLKVVSIETNENIIVNKRSLWKESVDLDDNFLEKPGTMKGKVIYTLEMEKISN